MSGRDETPRTVMPPRGEQRPAASAELYDRLAEPTLAYAERLATVRGEDLTALLRQAGVLLDRYSADLSRAGAIASTVAPARYALALVLDQKARDNRAIDVAAWAAGAHRFLFDGREVTVGRLHDFIRIAREAGHDFDGVRTFLERCAGRLEGARTRLERVQGSNWTGIVSVLVTAYLLAVAGWAGYTEWRHHASLRAVFAEEALASGLDRTGNLPDLAARLDRLRAAQEGVEDQAARAPIRLFSRLLRFDAAAEAGAVYADAVARHLPGAIAAAIDEAIASEGDPVALYDALRAWSVLSGTSPWSAAYLKGWLADRSAVAPDLSGLDRHAAALAPGFAPPPSPDAELLAQARTFAAEAAEPDRAFLELRRSDGADALADWTADGAVPDLSTILKRQSGMPMSQPVDGLFTAAGWTHARELGAGLAVQAARDEAPRLFGQPAQTQNDTPDAVLDLLQDRTIAIWAAFVADLRVTPFSDPDTAVIVSGRLAERASPLDGLFRAVWNEVGGNDRRRTHAQQLRIATRFGPMIQYVEQGRLSEISTLFAGLNVALGAMDRNAESGLQRLMSVQERASSIAALRAAPVVVVQIVEDVLAQTGQSHADLLSNPLTKAWQTEALAACQRATEGVFPFADSTAEADLSAVRELFAPGGVLDRFFRTRVERYLDMTGEEWRWKPEARFEGLSQDSAHFFQRARALGGVLFAPDGTIATELTLAALAERGKTFVTLGGQGGPVEATGEGLTLAWPGPEPAKGMEVSFVTAEGEARLAQPGPWGLHRLMGSVRLRERDGGRRFLVDLRAGQGRIFLQVSFPEARNPLATMQFLKGFACPAVL